MPQFHQSENTVVDTVFQLAAKHPRAVARAVKWLVSVIQSRFRAPKLPSPRESTTALAAAPAAKRTRAVGSKRSGQTLRSSRAQRLTDVDVTPGAVIAADGVPNTMQAVDVFEWTNRDAKVVVFRRRDSGAKLSIDFNDSTAIDACGRPTPRTSFSVVIEPGG
jgi:hypothetical protein